MPWPARSLRLATNVCFPEISATIPTRGSERERLRFQIRRGNPRAERIPRLLGNLELHRPLSLLLHDNRTRRDFPGLHHERGALPDRTRARCCRWRVEQCELARSMVQLEPNSDSPDLSFSFSGGFWPSSLPLFHGTTCPSVFVTASMSRSFIVGGGASCCSGRGRFTTRSSHSHCPKADLRRMNPNGIVRKVRHLFGAWKEIRYAATELPRGQVPRSTRAIRRPRWQKAHHRYCRAIQGSR